jgi:hypothetical protein
MTIRKQLAPDGTALDDHMDALLEVLAELLEEPQTPPETGADKQGEPLP